MIRRTILGVVVVLAIVAGFSHVDQVSAQKAVLSPQAVSPIMVEDFNYPVGQLTDAPGGAGANVSGGNWVTNTGTGSFLQVSAGSLSYTAYPSSGVGNKLEIVGVTTSAEDTFRNFPAQTSGTTYAAFMINVTNTTGLAPNTSTTGDYFAGFIASNSTTSHVGRIYIRAGSAPNTYNLGIKGTTTNAVAFQTSPTDLPVGTTALLVVSYQIVAGTTNDVVNLFINPVITDPEPVPSITQTTLGTDSANIGRFFVRQGSAGTPNASLDGIRVGTSWASLIATYLSRAPVDYNGDGKTDYSVVRNTGGGASGQVTWYNCYNGFSFPGCFQFVDWGIATDRFIPADFDGDGKADIAVWRAAAAGTAGFYIYQSLTNTLRFDNFGQNGDNPTIVADYTGDGKADPAVYRSGAAPGDQSFWYYRASSGTYSGQIVYEQWGQNGDFPGPGDYDGDGIADFMIQRDGGGGQAIFWLRTNTTNAVSNYIFGTPNDVIVPGDYDGDGKTDIATARGSGGAIVWFYRASTTGNLVYLGAFGNAVGDNPVQGDYDGDGKTDIAVWRPAVDPAATYFHWLGSTAGFTSYEWGMNGDYPVANYNTH